MLERRDHRWRAKGTCAAKACSHERATYNILIHDPRSFLHHCAQSGKGKIAFTLRARKQTLSKPMKHYARCVCSNVRAAFAASWPYMTVGISGDQWGSVRITGDHWGSVGIRVGISGDQSGDQ